MRERARELGFDAVGFARARSHPDGARLTAWLEAGRNGTMRWMARDPERRADPTAVLAEARTVISLAIGYYRGGWPGPPSAADASTPRGLIARYAWGRDYHKVIRKRLLALASTIRDLEPAPRFLAYVDTGPVLDRAWAERSGLGWIGKNTNLIRKSAGSWHFLGEILTDLELPADEPHRNYCGVCSRCITACPTGAIVGPYQLDARRCISYLTIEHGGAIPLELRRSIGTRIFGCDDCQEVCPWNRFATPTADPAFEERPDQQTPELISLLRLDEETFRRRYAGTALRRAGRNRFVRNVAVALGNARDARAVPALEAALHGDPDRQVRGHAAWALGRIGGVTAAAALERAADRESDPDVIEEIGYARREIDGPTHGGTP
ncbi:MAG TPA: tRNA epoxyqueuosine(34) reductase QueG [Candidatus Eisenbacteria bacterium]|nr:tRNA epoxyqueuosine(34) reductase QueG [Candidatus Eisenbacteria bacterium]